MSKAVVLKAGMGGIEPFAFSPKASVGAALAAHRRDSGHRTKAELAYEEGFAAGKSDGYAAGREQGLTDGAEAAFEQAQEIHRYELDQFRLALGQIVPSVEAAMAEWFAASEEQLTDLVCEVARKVLASELQQDRSSIVNIVKRSIEELGTSRLARIRVNPFDSATLEDARDELLALASDLRQIEIVGDGSIAGGCKIETDGALVDATIESKMAALEESFEEAA